ncbi:hypothetical protein DSM43518_00644 [Mycobacterium marinum]|nr:hypothetical protein MM1218R_01409 [Mycobacterium marinum]CDM75558.1 hypothetical protein MMARE11_14100 [Mycobacterium marinum E11]AXN48820.1 hypothetical protein CCUG20998_01402 [Mycobacterium marinum]RFZ11589.1 hypothetical protein DE4381_01178 [Mycobacterium marinum]RFZ14623.1 hypothetical protein DSM43518_00644 [Mycobacterium marinum]
MPSGGARTEACAARPHRWALAGLDDIAAVLLFPILLVNSENGNGLINHYPLAWCAPSADHLYPAASGQQARQHYPE